MEKPRSQWDDLGMRVNLISEWSSSAVLQRFQGKMFAASRARLLAVAISDQLLTEIGYFVD